MPAAQSELPLVTVRNAGVLIRLLAGWFATALVPRSFDRRIPPLLSSVYCRVRADRVAALAGEMDRVLGLRDAGIDSTRVARQYVRMRMEGEWDRFRRLHRPRPQAEAPVDGLEHYRAALEAGRGVVLWRMQFGSSPIVDAALHQHGVVMSHLSHPTHGLGSSDSRFGRSVVVPFFARAETWYLRERVVLAEQGDFGYLRRLMAVLAGNGTVSIIGELPGRQGVSAPVLGEPVQYATGAPALSYRMGAALLPVHAKRERPGAWRVTIDHPITVSRDLGKRAYVVAAIEEYARRLDRQIRARPEDWLGWFARLPAPGATDTRRDSV